MESSIPASARHIVLIVADSLRFDSVYGASGPGVPYMEAHARQFVNATSSACWTLPATASMFTGMLPHEHGATTQTRRLPSDKRTLAEILKTLGYKTVQITANVATTEIFGLDRGFDQVIKIWHEQKPKHGKLFRLLMMMGKPRIRKKVLSKDMLANQFAEDLLAGTSWLQSYYQQIFDRTSALLREADKRGEKVFVFINLMETHFPYHIDHEFKMLNRGALGKLRELQGMFNVVNQTFLTKEDAFPSSKTLKILQERQRLSWELIRKDLDGFVESLHRDSGNLVIFTSDHGENFGDQNWVYHFSNVSDACTRVPLFWLDHHHDFAGKTEEAVNARLLFHSIAKAAGYSQLNGEDLFTNNVYNIPISQSYWYNNQGKTLAKYRFNQFCFKYNGHRYLKRNGSWYHALETDFSVHDAEPVFSRLDNDTNPIHEWVDDRSAQHWIAEKLEAFNSFENELTTSKN